MVPRLVRPGKLSLLLSKRTGSVLHALHSRHQKHGKRPYLAGRAGFLHDRSGLVMDPCKTEPAASKYFFMRDRSNPKWKTPSFESWNVPSSESKSATAILPAGRMTPAIRSSTIPIFWMWWNVMLLTTRSNCPGNLSPLSRSTSRVRTLARPCARTFASRTSSMPCELSTAVIERTCGGSAKGEKARPTPEVQHIPIRTRLYGSEDRMSHSVRHLYPARVFVPGCRCGIEIAFFTGHNGDPMVGGANKNNVRIGMGGLPDH